MSAPWWSTGDNIDAWWCFDLAADLYGDARYRAAADRIKAALETDGWNNARGDILARRDLRRGPQHA